MKFLVFLLPLIVILLHVAADEEELLEKCAKCFAQEEVPVCSTNKGTFYNLCLLQCAQAEYLYDGSCNGTALTDIDKNEK